MIIIIIISSSSITSSSSSSSSSSSIRSSNNNQVYSSSSIAGHARCQRSRATHGAIDRGPRTVPSIVGHGATHGAIDRGPRGHARCHRSRATGPRTVPSIAHRLLLVFAFRSLAGRARCHRSRTVYLLFLHLNLSRATHGAIDRGPRTVPSIARHGHRKRKTDTAEPRIRYYRDAPSSTVYLLFLHLNLRSGAQDSTFVSWLSPSHRPLLLLVVVVVVVVIVLVFPVCTGLRLAEAILSLTTPKLR